MIIPIPSFLFPLNTPTPENIQACRDIGLFSKGTQYFESPEALIQATGLATTAFAQDEDGPCKLCRNTGPNFPDGAVVLDGTTHPAGKMSLFENTTYSQSARGFYAERPNLPVPTLIKLKVSPEEWKRLSTNAGRPAEYLMGEIRAGQPETISSNIVCWMQEGKAVVAWISEAAKVVPPEKPGAGATASLNWANDGAKTARLIVSLEENGVEGDALGNAVNAAARKTL